MRDVVVYVGGGDGDCENPFSEFLSRPPPSLALRSSLHASSRENFGEEFPPPAVASPSSFFKRILPIPFPQTPEPPPPEPEPSLPLSQIWLCTPRL